jgi:hypothetical protein
MYTLLLHVCNLIRQPDVSGPGSSTCRLAYERLRRAVVRHDLTFSYASHAPVAGSPPRKVNC